MITLNAAKKDIEDLVKEVYNEHIVGSNESSVQSSFPRLARLQIKKHLRMLDLASYDRKAVIAHADNMIEVLKSQQEAENV